jgi:hypothetical protein
VQGASGKRRTWLIALVVLAAVVGAGLIGGLAVLVGQSMFASKGVTSLPSSTLASATPTAVAATATAVATTTPAVTPPPAESTVKPETNTDGDVTHQSTFITKYGKDADGVRTLTFDYMQFLTGTAAEKAAAKHGDTVENDYYVLNENTKKRTFPVASAVIIVLHPGEGPNYKRTFTFAEFRQLMDDGSLTKAGKNYSWSKETIFNVNVKKGQVVRIENLWVP